MNLAVLLFMGRFYFFTLLSNALKLSYFLCSEKKYGFARRNTAYRDIRENYDIPENYIFLFLTFTVPFLFNSCWENIFLRAIFWLFVGILNQISGIMVLLEFIPLLDGVKFLVTKPMTPEEKKKSRAPSLMSRIIRGLLSSIRQNIWGIYIYLTGRNPAPTYTFQEIDDDYSQKASKITGKKKPKIYTYGGRKYIQVGDSGLIVAYEDLTR